MDLLPKPRGFMLDVHDWLAYLSGSPYLYAQYEMAFLAGPYPRCRNQKIVSSFTSRPLTQAVLSTRTTMVLHLIELAVRCNTDYHNLYYHMRTTLTDPVRFAPIGDRMAWDQFDLYSLNDAKLNLGKQKILQSGWDLANRNDETNDALDTHHGMLTSFSVLYIFHHVLAILDYMSRAYPSPGLDLVYKEVIDTTVRLKGVIVDGQT